MAMRIKSQVYTVIFSIILIGLENWGSIAAQQQQLQQVQQLKGKPIPPLSFMIIVTYNHSFMQSIAI